MKPITHDTLNGIQNKESLFAFLKEHLGWHVQPEDPFTYSINIDQNRVTTTVQVSRLVPFSANDPFLIVLTEFDGSLRRTDLREILRQIRAEIRTRAAYSGRSIEEIIFLCTVNNYRGFRFARFVQKDQGQPLLQTFGWEKGDSSIRTLCEFNLPALFMPPKNAHGDYDWTIGKAQWLTAWDVEKFTDTFFREYKRLFDNAESLITGVEGDQKRLFTQKLFNRLMFVRFLEKKGWLRFNGQREYLRALWRGYQDKKQQANDTNFYNERLRLLFFSALNNSQERNQMTINRGGVLKELIGEVPFLNGGLFEEGEEERKSTASVPDEAIQPLIDELFYKFNFTVTESTPLDVEVAVDPEMLGKVFEELVTGRHESGSFYTPRPVVAFMCREALKGYLQSMCPEETPEAVARFVDEHNPAGLRRPEAVLHALREVKACDPACGSGAYLLGLLHELLDLRKALFASHQIDPKTIYERKLEIIRENLYGVDSDEFAVNIARLRLWLSLVVDDTRNPLDEPDVDVALPNLDFKIEVGDSLLAPDPQGGSQADLFRLHQIDDFDRLKNEFLQEHHSGKKGELENQIKALREEISQWMHPDGKVEGFDWRVEFAEVFKEGGFDIVLANPPYVRQELIPNKAALQRNYPEAVVGRSDLYVYFYVRGLQLLKPEGMHVFVCSNSWLDVGFGGALQRYLLNNTHIIAIYDSAVERQFASADVNTIISILKKRTPRDEDETAFVRLNAPFEEALANPAKQRIIVRTTAQLRESGSDERGIYEGDKWGGKYLRAPDIFFTILQKGEQNRVFVWNGEPIIVSIIV